MEQNNEQNAQQTYCTLTSCRMWVESQFVLMREKVGWLRIRRPTWQQWFPVVCHLSSEKAVSREFGKIRKTFNSRQMTNIYLSIVIWLPNLTTYLLNRTVVVKVFAMRGSSSQLQPKRVQHTCTEQKRSEMKVAWKANVCICVKDCAVFELNSINYGAAPPTSYNIFNSHVLIEMEK